MNETSFQETKAIQTERELEFAVFCIENLAVALDKPSDRVYRALTENSNILNQYIVPSYDVLHTQGREYIVNDILEVMTERGVVVTNDVSCAWNVGISGERRTMTANRNLLRMKFARVIEAYAKRTGCSLDEALRVFYQSQTYEFMRDGVSNMHCMSENYLVEELLSENTSL